ncbi:MAG: peptidase [Glaciihabitans sp.]|nr:peptidase [Glaciihabitans sp.]
MVNTAASPSTPTTISADALATMADTINERWAGDFLTHLQKMVRIPAVSPSFAPEWAADGHLDAIVEYAADWLNAQGDPDLTVTISRLPGQTPLLIATLPGSTPDAKNVLLYGHLDKQPGGGGWTATSGPWEPLVKDGYLYGRGSADDVYALFAMWGAIVAAKASGADYPSTTLLLEASEESSSCDLPDHIDALADIIGQPDLVVCLDAFTPNYERLWSTSSLRGIVVMDVTVSILSATTHSGDAGSIVPSPFRIMRQLFDRIEDSSTGEILLPELTVELPDGAAEIIDQMSDSGLDFPTADFPMLENITPDHVDLRTQFLKRAWTSSVTYAGMDGFPSSRQAASVILPSITTRLSVRIPPTLDPQAAAAALTAAFETSPPSNAQVTVDVIAAEAGFSALPLSDKLAAAVQSASQRNYGKPSANFAAGVTIPFVGMLGRRFPAANVLTIGALGPDSNPHSPNEALNLDAAARITRAVSEILVTGF